MSFPPPDKTRLPTAPPPEASIASRAAWWRDRLLINRAVAYAVAARIWQFLAGGISIFVIARAFTPELQGVYYAFISLLAIQSFFDLGLTGVLIYVASHEWGAAQSDEPAVRDRARQRLGDLIRRSRRWYAACAVAYAVVATVAGLLFFRNQAPGELSWRFPWIASTLVIAGSLWLSPTVVILEGCNFVAQVNLARLAQAVIGNLVVWSTMLAGGALWAVTASAGVRLLMDALLVFYWYRPFLSTMLSSAEAGAPLSWKSELLPLQWRIAIQSVTAYLLFQLFTLIIYAYHGAAEAGRMGMTWNVLSTLQLIAYAWIQTGVPQLGRLIAEQQPRAARSYFRRLFAVCLAVYAAGGAALIVAVLAAARWLPQLADRLLDPGTVLLFEIVLGLTLTVSGLATFVRAHKIDPFLGIGTLNAALTGTLVWWWGAARGPAGAAAAHFVTNALIMLPATFLIYRGLVRRTGSHAAD